MIPIVKPRSVLGVCILPGVVDERELDALVGSVRQVGRIDFVGAPIFTHEIHGILGHVFAHEHERIRFDVKQYAEPSSVPEPALRALLARLPGRKVVFTNAPRHHAEQVLRLLDVGDAFEAVLTLEDLDYRPKPDGRAYRAVTGRLGVEAARCTFVDDTKHNLVAARRDGMRTVWLTGERSEDSDVTT